MVRLRSKSCPPRLRLSGAGGDGATRPIRGPLGAPARPVAAGPGSPDPPQASVGSKTRSAVRRSSARNDRGRTQTAEHAGSRPHGHGDTEQTRDTDRHEPRAETQGEQRHTEARRHTEQQTDNTRRQQVDVVIAQGRNMVSDGVRMLTEEKVGRLAHRCPGLERAEVQFSEEHNPRIADRECCEVTIVGHGRIVRARASAPAPLGRRRPGGGEARAPARESQGTAPGGPHRSPPPGAQLRSRPPRAGANRLTTPGRRLPGAAGGPGRQPGAAGGRR